MKTAKTSFLFFYFLSLSCSICLAQKTKDSIQYYSRLATYPQNAQDINKALLYFKSSYKTSFEINDTLKIIYSLFHISSLKYKKGLYDVSEASAVEALQLANTTHKNQDYVNRLKKSIYNQLGIIYRRQKNKEKAIELYNRSIESAESAKDTATIYNNLANVYKEHGALEEAKNELLKAYKIVLEIKDLDTKALILDNLGVIHSKLGNKHEGLKLMKEALNLREKLRDTSKLYTSYSHLSKHYNSIENKTLAKEYGEKVYGIAKKINSPVYLENALGLLTEISDDQYAKDYKKLKDSIDFAEALKENEFAFMKYEYSEYKRRAAESELEKQKAQNMKLLYFLLAITIAFAAISIYLIQRSKHKKDKIKHAYLKETELSKKVHDELANDMSDLMNYVENHIEVSNRKKTKLLDHIEDLYLRTRDISTETASIDLTHFSKSLSNLLSQHNRNNTKVVSNNISTINWKKVPNYKKMVIYRCLQELMVNMKNHSKAKLVSIIFKEHNRKKEIYYVDDGVGFSVKDIRLNGLQNVESRIKSIQGTFSFTTSEGNGLKAILKFNG